tara:strand:+ start:7378 stop:7563 length:186 start_codon:yes stop_codon:yes gene_type:complete
MPRARNSARSQRAAGEDGLIYDSPRHQGGVAIFTYPPSKVLDVVQAEHLDIAVESESSMFR